MKPFSYRNNPQVLQDFLYELVCEVKQPQQTELLIEILRRMEQPVDRVRDDRWAVTPIDRARIHR
jgi:7,8-dihydro-6-hydroxymethylpterin-pyrophosphokinase